MTVVVAQNGRILAAVLVMTNVLRDTVAAEKQPEGRRQTDAPDLAPRIQKRVEEAARAILEEEGVTVK